MQGGVNVYPPFWVSPVRVIVVVGCIIAIVAGNILVRNMLRNLALRAQRKLTEAAQRKDPGLLDQALVQLTNLYNAYTRRELAAAATAEQMSAIVREAYDQAMNHRTRYQARYEMAARRLAAMSELVAHSYPVEFADDGKQVAADEAIATIFAKAKEVIESCR